MITTELYNSVAKSYRPREIDHWHCSSIAKCPAALYLERKGTPPLSLPGAGKMLRWAAGHAIEEVIRPHLQSVYPTMLSNVRFLNKDLDLTGEYDGYDPVTKTLISVKSVHDYAMITRDGRTALKEDTGKLNARGSKVWDFKDAPYAHHEWQEHAYVLLMSKKNNHYINFDQLQDELVSQFDVAFITYVYITLSGLIDTYTTPVKPEILKRVSDKVDYLNKCWKDSTFPICLCREDQEMWKETNQYCEYKRDQDCCSKELLKEAK